MQIPDPAPVALFVYNRLDTTRKTIESLKRNLLADRTELFVFSDGGRDEKAWKKVNRVRAYLQSVTGFKQVHLVFRPENFYLERNVIEGINEVFQSFDRIIVLEDDIISSPYFLTYMNDALEYYKDEPRVCHVAGFTNIYVPELGDTYLCHHMTGYGAWGTWRSCWQANFRHFTSRQEALQGLDTDTIDRISMHGNFPCLNSLDRTPIPWDICWEIAQYKNDTLCLHPTRPLVRNIGLAGGTHFSGLSHSKIFGWYEFDRKPFLKPVKVGGIPLCPTPSIDERLAVALKDHGMRYNLLGRIVRKNVQSIRKHRGHKKLRHNPPSIYFYHSHDALPLYRLWQQKEFPGHLLYGATHLEKFGYKVIWHSPRGGYNRLKRSLHTAYKILQQYRKLDIVYARDHFGLEIIVFLRALRIFRKPVVIWYHTAVVNPQGKFRSLVSKLFYKGIDHAFFFSEKLRNDSTATGKLKPEQCTVVHWGPDLDFYDKIRQVVGSKKEFTFISTGKEKRDMATLLTAFKGTDIPITVFISHKTGPINYDKEIQETGKPENVEICYPDGLQHTELAYKVAEAKAVIICCRETTYTVGLTTVAEALGLGLPIICSDNPTFDMNLEKENAGLLIPYRDIQGWKKAVTWMWNNPDKAAIMGQNGRHLAETRYNLDIMASEINHTICKIV